MFSRWIFARLKAAENALNDGRIDEAHERLAAPEVKNLRRAQDLLDALAKSLLARARLHARAGRYPETLSDLERLQTIERVDAEAKALRQRVEDEQRQRVGRHAERDDAFNRAARDIKAGRLESGQLAVDRLEDAGRREQLREELDLRVRRSAQLLEQGRGALAAGDGLTACRFWEEACTRHGRSRQSDALAAELVLACRALMGEAFKAGRLDRLWAALETTKSLRAFAPSLSEFERLSELTRRAAERLAEADYVTLREALLRLQAACGEAGWIKAALKPIDEIVRAQSELLASPLGLLGTSLHKMAPFRKGDAAFGRHNGSGPEQTVCRGRGAAFNDRALLMLVDGTGSVLLVARDVIRVGRAGSLSALDVPIPADIQSHHADLIRDGEDYFLVARGPVRVNHRQVARTLLRHGDRIALGSKVRMIFHKPSAKSDTAVLKLSSGCRLPQDVSLVVLFKGTCLLGPQSSCHVRTREGDTRLVLFDRAGKLFVRRAARDGRPTGPAEALPADETCDFGDVRLTVKEYESDSSGGLA
ncbi:MAG: FHA domain-containing protein [Phycisphaerae bacterium]